ncbi:MAG: substrate-binding domain-containing protein, partial [Armatimonadetes bacterium]|nr:substrate-binding domain-containing protein [Armatimonadota bacterium]
MKRLPSAFAMVVLVSLILLAAGLTGCGRQQAPSATPTAGPVAPPGGAAPAADTGTAKARYTIAVVPKGTAHVFWKTVEAGARQAGKDLGAEILWNGPAEETDVAGQISILEDFITRKVDALVMAACDAKALVPVVQKALKQNIPVITIDSGIATDDALCFVATDNVKGA